MVPIKKRALAGIMIPIIKAIALRKPVQNDRMNIDRAVANHSREYLSLSFSLLINSKVTINIESDIAMAIIRNDNGIFHFLNID